MSIQEIFSAVPAFNEATVKRVKKLVA